MLTEPQRRLVEALRSGEFSQATDYLRVIGVDGSASYCCLGVACEIYRRETGLGHWDDVAFHASEHDSNNGILPHAVQEYFGFTDAGSTFAQDGELTQLTILNDAGYSFEQIADVIESEPHGLLR